MGNIEGTPTSNCTCPHVSMATQSATSSRLLSDDRDVTTRKHNRVKDSTFTNSVLDIATDPDDDIPASAYPDEGDKGRSQKFVKTLFENLFLPQTSPPIHPSHSKLFTTIPISFTERASLEPRSNSTVIDTDCSCISELEDPWNVHQHICEVTLLVISTVIIFANVVVIGSIARSKWDHYGKRSSSRLSRSYIFILNLALADLFVGLVNIVCISLNQSKYLYMYLYENCLLQISFLISSCCASVFTMTIIGVDRYLAVMHPYNYKSWVTSSKALLTVLSVWVLACVIGFAPIMGWSVLQTEYKRQGMICSYLYIVEPSYVLFTLFGGFLPQLILIIYLNVKIYKVSKKHQKEISQLNTNKPRCSLSRDNSVAPFTVEDQFSSSTGSKSCPVTPVAKNKTNVYRSNGNAPPPLAQRNSHRTVSFGPSSFTTNYTQNFGTPRRSVEIEVIVEPEVVDMVAHDNVFDNHLDLPGSTFNQKPFHKVSRDFSSIPRSSNVSRSFDVGKLRKTVSYAGSAAILSITSQISRIGHLKRDVMKRNIKALRTVALVVGFFFFMWTPFLVTSVVQMLCGAQCELENLVGTYLLVLGITNSAINPMVYTYTNKELKKQIRRCCCGDKRLIVTNHQPMMSETLPDIQTSQSAPDLHSLHSLHDPLRTLTLPSFPDPPTSHITKLPNYQSSEERCEFPASSSSAGFVIRNDHVSERSTANIPNQVLLSPEFAPKLTSELIPKRTEQTTKKSGLLSSNRRKLSLIPSDKNANDSLIIFNKSF